MKTKTILPLAIMLALPIAAHATGPTPYSGNSPTVATASAPYQTVTPEAHANEHIASTQYVIGAYNDAIAAVNKVANDKQDKLFGISNGKDVSKAVIDGEIMGQIMAPLGAGTENSHDEITNSMIDLSYGLETDMDNVLVSVNGVISGVGAAIDYLRDNAIAEKQDQITTIINNEPQNINSRLSQTIGQTPSATDLVSAAGIANYVNNKRVNIYTTWGDDRDSATQQVAFVNAQ